MIKYIVRNASDSFPHPEDEDSPHISRAYGPVSWDKAQQLIEEHPPASLEVILVVSADDAPKRNN